MRCLQPALTCVGWSLLMVRKSSRRRRTRCAAVSLSDASLKRLFLGAPADQSRNRCERAGAQCREIWRWVGARCVGRCWSALAMTQECKWCSGTSVRGSPTSRALCAMAFPLAKRWAWDYRAASAWSTCSTSGAHGARARGGRCPMGLSVRHS